MVSRIPVLNSIKTKIFLFIIIAVFVMCAFFAVIISVLVHHNSLVRTAASFQSSFSMLNQFINENQTNIRRDSSVIAENITPQEYSFSGEDSRKKLAMYLGELSVPADISAAAVFGPDGRPAAFFFKSDGEYYTGFPDDTGSAVIYGDDGKSAETRRFSVINRILGHGRLQQGYSFDNVSGMLAVKYTVEKPFGKGKIYVMTTKFLDYDFIRRVSDVTGMTATYYINGNTIFDNKYRPEASLNSLFPLKHVDAAMVNTDKGVYSIFQRWVISEDMSVDFGFYMRNADVEATRRNIIYGFAALLLISFTFVVPILYFLLNRAVSKPLKELEAAIKKVEAVDYSDSLNIDSVDEISGLVNSYNDLISRVREREEELQKANSRLEKMVMLETGKRQKNEQLLFDQQKFVDMGQMVNAIAHQWRQPLNIIGLSVQSFLIDYRDNRIKEGDAEEFEQNVMKMLMHMSGTIDDFRNFFKADKTKKEFSVVDTVSEIIRIVSAQMKYNGITVNYVCRCLDGLITYDDEAIEHRPCECVNSTVLGYQGEMKQAILNILQNAKDAILLKTPSEELFEGIVDVVAESDGEKITLTISDNGGGIPEETLPHIFEPYYTTKGDTGGTGIGLYMTKSIIEQHMLGTISASNNESGAVFTITVPLYKDGACAES